MRLAHATALPFAVLAACGGAAQPEPEPPAWARPTLVRVRLPGLPDLEVEETALEGQFGRFLVAARRALELPAPPAPPASDEGRKAWMARRMLPYLHAHVRARADVVDQLGFLTEGSARQQVYGSAALGRIAERRAQAEALLPAEESEAPAQRGRARQHYRACLRIATEEKLADMARFCRGRMAEMPPD